MYKACYLLDTGKFDKLAAWEALLDQERLQKYARIKNEKTARQSVGAGLLLQLAAGEYLLGKYGEGTGTVGEGKWGEQAGSASRGFSMDYLDGDALRVRMKKAGVSFPLDLRYDHNDSGKPYFANLPLRFSLSHSGEWVLCACSLREVGCDVQKMTGINWQTLSKRFFAGEETEYLDRLPEEAAQDAFFQLWTKKEAYGKLLGEGVLKMLNVSLLEETNALSWQQGHFDSKDGERYHYAICEESLTKMPSKEMKNV